MIFSVTSTLLALLFATPAVSVGIRGAASTDAFCCWWPPEATYANGKCAPESKAVGFCAQTPGNCNTCNGIWCDVGAAADIATSDQSVVATPPVEPDPAPAEPVPPVKPVEAPPSVEPVVVPPPVEPAVATTSTTSAGDCSENCPLGGCDCLCGSTKNILSPAEVAAVCSQFSWNQANCECIISHESAGNANAVHLDGTYDVGLFQINEWHWTNPPCDEQSNAAYAFSVYSHDNTWRQWSACSACGCCDST